MRQQQHHHRQTVKRNRVSSGTRIPSAFALAAALALLLATATAPPARSQQQQPADARPRRTTTTAPAATTTQTPKPNAAAATQRATPTPTPSSSTGRPTLTTMPRIEDNEEAPRLKKTFEEEAQEIGDEETLKIDTSLINLQVRVINRDNKPISDVRKEEFRVFENNVAQTVEYFSREQVPIQYGLVIDNSGSMRALLPKVIEASKTIVNSNKPGDETFIVRFIDNEKIETLIDFTSDQTELLDTLEEKLYIDGGQTAVIDAVYLSADHVARYKKGNDLDDRTRRALIVVTDGEDRASFYKQEQLFASLSESNVQIYFIGFVNELDREGGIIRKSPRAKAVELINRMAKETGGRAFFPESVNDLPGIADEITRDLRTQYIVSYRPTDRARAGEFRKVDVRIADAPGKEKRLALTRAGYIAGRDGGAARPATTATPPATSNKPQPASANRP